MALRSVLSAGFNEETATARVHSPTDKGQSIVEDRQDIHCVYLPLLTEPHKVVGKISCLILPHSRSHARTLRPSLRH